MLTLSPPPQPVHIETSTVAAESASHLPCLARSVTIASAVSAAKVRTRCGAKATAVIATLIVAVTAGAPIKGKEAGVSMQFAPVGAGCNQPAMPRDGQDQSMPVRTFCRLRGAFFP